MSPRASQPLSNCSQVAPLLVFFACGELEPFEQEQIAAHLQNCAACAQQLQEELALQAAIQSAPQPAEQLDPSGSLLAQCRSELSEALDELAKPRFREHWMPFGWVRRCIVGHPAWSAATLVLFGLVVGTRLALWIPWSGNANGAGQAMNVLAAPRLTDEDLSKMNVAGIQFAPSSDAGPGTLQVHVFTERPLTVSGNMEDSDVRRVLTYVIANGDRFAPGVRLDSMDALKGDPNHQEVRQALLTAARKDQNPAVRIKALETLWDSEQDDRARETVLYALSHDANPGVRVEAVNLLVRSLQTEPLEAGDVPAASLTATNSSAFSDDGSRQEVVHALQELQLHDSSRYVRSRSTAALRQIASRNWQ